MVEKPDTPWWESRTIIGAVVTVAASLAALAGYTIDIGQAIDIVLSLTTLAGGALALWGRIRASTVISRTKVLPRVSVVIERRPSK